MYSEAVGTLPSSGMNMLSVQMSLPCSGMFQRRALFAARPRGHVARPGEGRGDVAPLQVGHVVVAREPADLTRVDRFLDPVVRLVPALVGDLARIVAVLEHDRAHRVGDLGEQRHLALELRVLEQLLHRRHDLAAARFHVRRDAGDPGQPRNAVGAVGIERRALLRVDQVRDVRDPLLVQLLDPLLADEQPGKRELSVRTMMSRSIPRPCDKRPWIFPKYVALSLTSST